MSCSLDRYAAKRRFARTPEPTPQPARARPGPLLFVIQKHAARRLHYDFRLELDGVLKSWAVPKGPSLEPTERRLAVEVEDHPFAYASFEGVIPEKEYGAGRVIVWDCGVWSPDEEEQYDFDDRERAQARAREALASGKLSLFLRGEKLKGSFALVRTSESRQWLLIKHRDRFAGSDTVLAESRSVLSGFTLEQMRASPQAGKPAEALVPAGPHERAPTELAPMLAEQAAPSGSDPRWLYEPKLDGYRVVAFVRSGVVSLRSRRGLDLTPQFPEIVAALAEQRVEQLILDGEIVALGPDGRPSFNALQNRAQLTTAREIEEAQRRAPAILVSFDLLHFAGCNLRAAPYEDRRRYLAQCLLPGEHLQLVHVSEEAEGLYAAALASGFEGIVAKRRDSRYEPGKRSAAWQKIKASRSIDLVVGGYTRGKGAREPLGALLLGYYQSKALRYAGHVGSGLSAESEADLLQRLTALKHARSPFETPPPLHRPTQWVQPQLVVEVSFQGWTPDGLLRAPVFLRRRDDIAPRAVGPPAAEEPRPARATARRRGSRESASQESRPDRSRKSARAGKSVSQAEPATRTDPAEIASVLEQLRGAGARLDLDVAGVRIRLTHLDRIYWPADPDARRPPVSKRDLLRYLAAVAPYMLPHLEDRPLTMIRMPEGIDGERFFQKHWDQPLPPFVETVTVYSGHREQAHRYMLANNLPTLLWLAQHGTLEFHIWHSRARPAADCISQSTDYASSEAALDGSVLNFPDYLVFDIDPYIYSGKEPPGAEPELNRAGFAGGRRVAFWLRELLAQMSLQPIVKTSGKTGLHVFVPIERSVTFDAARQICETVGRHVMRAHPRDITMEWAVQKRTGKIFIDYNMNVRGKTLNVAYSPRGVPGAPISMPLTWEELEAAEPTHFTLHNVLARLEKTGDRWHDALRNKQSLARAFGQSQRP